MKRTKLIFALMSLVGILGTAVSCKSTEAPAPVAVVEEPSPVPAPDPEPIPAPEPEPEPEPVVVPEPAPEPEPEEDNSEYLRSIGDVNVDVDTYTQDKEAIMKIIADLARIMDVADYASWRKYVDEESKSYWSLRPNLQKAERKLPVKGLKLANLEAYFKHVFIPARKGREVTEIRYVSDSYVKAVQVQEDQDIIFYYFNKIDGKWLLHLAKLED